MSKLKNQHLSKFFPRSLPEDFDRLSDEMAAELLYVANLCNLMKLPLNSAVSGIKAAGSGRNFHRKTTERFMEAGRRGAEAGRKARAELIAKHRRHPFMRELR